MQHEPKKYLYDARCACDAIAQFTNGKTRDQYMADPLLRSAVERQFEILGEAFSRLSALAPAYREQCPDMGKIIGMRNRIIHGYDTVDNEIVWDAVTNHVSRLRDWIASTDT